jgi:phosphoribosylglycinamide formyltransferase-1
MKQLRVVVFFSGTGSTLKALIDKQTNYKIVATVCNNPHAEGIAHTINANIPCHVIDQLRFANKIAFEQEVMRCLKFYDFEIIALAGYMHILSPEFVLQYTGRIINIHPSLLPKYPGLNTYAKALAAGDKEHGTTIHYVTAEIDAGEIIAQQQIPITPDDDITSLTNKTKAAEQALYPQILNKLAAHFA